MPLSRRQIAVFTVTLAVGLTVALYPTPEGLTPQGQRALAVFAISFILWTTHTLPLAVTSLLALVLLPLLGVMDTSTAFSLFGNRAVFFILGAFIMAAAMMRSGLSSRVALFFLRGFDRSPRRLLAGVLFTSALLSFLMPEHAVAALLFPIVLEIAGTLGLERGLSNYGKGLFLSLAWGAVIGGVATLLGGARNPLALALLWDHYQISLSFLDWMVAVIPLVVVLWCLTFVLILIVFPFGLRDVSGARVMLDQKVKSLGRLTGRELRVSVIVMATVAAWVTVGPRVGLANISIMSAVALFVVNAIHWRDVEDYVNWGVILMYGGAVALGSALAQTKAAEWVTLALLDRVDMSPFMVLVFITLAAKVITEGMSNAAAVAVLLPVVYGVADQLALSPVGLTFAVAVPAGLAFSFPMGTPPNAIAYSAGYYRLRDSVMTGLILNLAAWILFLVMVRYYWPRVGMSYLADSLGGP